MNETTVKFENGLTKQSVEDWADARGFLAEDRISLHLEELFGIERIVIHSADNQGEFLLLKVSSEQWTDQREFALMPTGSLAW